MDFLDVGDYLEDYGQLFEAYLKEKEDPKMFHASEDLATAFFQQLNMSNLTNAFDKFDIDLDDLAELASAMKDLEMSADDDELSVVHCVKDPKEMLSPWSHNPMFTTILTTYSITFIVGLLANSAAIASLATEKKKHRNAFLISSLSADIVLLVIGAPLQAAAYFVLGWDENGMVCKAAVFVDFLTAVSVVMNLTAVSLERFLVIAFPLQSRSWCSNKNSLRGAIFIWILSALIALPNIQAKDTIAMEYSNNQTSLVIFQCLSNEDVNLFWVAFTRFLILFLLPAVVMITCYSSAIRHLWRSSNIARYLTNQLPRRRSSAMRQFEEEVSIAQLSNNPSKNQHSPVFIQMRTLVHQNNFSFCHLKKITDPGQDSAIRAKLVESRPVVDPEHDLSTDFTATQAHNIEEDPKVNNPAIVPSYASSAASARTAAVGHLSKNHLHLHPLKKELCASSKSLTTLATKESRRFEQRRRYSAEILERRERTSRRRTVSTGFDEDFRQRMHRAGGFEVVFVPTPSKRVSRSFDGINANPPLTPDVADDVVAPVTRLDTTTKAINSTGSGPTSFDERGHREATDVVVVNDQRRRGSDSSMIGATPATPGGGRRTTDAISCSGLSGVVAASRLGSQQNGRSLPIGPRRARHIITTRKRLKTMLMAHIILFMVCWGPRLLWDVFIYSTADHTYSNVMYAARVFLFLLPFVHASFNPILYFCMSSTLRASFTALATRGMGGGNVAPRGGGVGAAGGLDSVGAGRRSTLGGGTGIVRRGINLHNPTSAGDVTVGRDHDVIDDNNLESEPSSFFLRKPVVRTLTVVTTTTSVPTFRP